MRVYIEMIESFIKAKICHGVVVVLLFRKIYHRQKCLRRERVYTIYRMRLKNENGPLCW